MGPKPHVFEWLGWAALTEYVLNDLWLTHEGEYTDQDTAEITGWAFSTAWLFAVGSVVKQVGTWPLAVILAAFWAGKWTSQVIDPDEGKENFYGYVSGGIYGADPNYRAYFNISLNTQIILQHFILQLKKPAMTTTTFDGMTKEEFEEYARNYTVSSGQFQTTPAYLFQHGMITSEEYLRRITKEQAQAAKAKWDKKAKEEAQSKWKSLSKSEQKDIVNSQRQIRGAINFW